MRSPGPHRAGRDRHRRVARDRQGSGGRPRRARCVGGVRGALGGREARRAARARSTTPCARSRPRAARRSRSAATSAKKTDIHDLVDETVARVRSARRAREQRDGADAGAARRVDRRGVGRVDARQRAQPLRVHPRGDAAHGRRRWWQHREHLVARRRARDDAVHAARLSHLLRGQGRARALHERRRARARAARHLDQRAAPGRGQDRDDRDRVRARRRLERLGDARVGRPARRGAGRGTRGADVHRPILDVAGFGQDMSWTWQRSTVPVDRSR